MERLALILKQSHIYIVALCSLFVGWLSVLYPAHLPGIALGLLWGMLLLVIIRGTGRMHQDKWFKKVLVFGLLLRVPLVLIHLAVGYWIYGGTLDFPGYFTHGVRIGQDLVASWKSFFEFLFVPENKEWMRTWGRTSNPGFLEFLSVPGSRRGTAFMSRLISLEYFLTGPSLWI